MGKLRKIGKKIGRGIKSVGRKLKSGLGKVAKAFGKLGPLGSIALSFMLPGIGSWISSVAQGSSFLAPIAQGLVNAGNFVKNGVGKVFNKVTDAIEYSMNKVSSFAGGEGMAGSNFKNWVSETTGGFIEPSTKGIEPITVQGETFTRTGSKQFGPPEQTTFTRPETTISAEAQVGIGGPKIPKPPKGMSKDAVFVDGIDTDLKKGFYEQADLDKFYKGETVGATLSDSATESYSTMIQSSEGVIPPKPGSKYFQRAKNAYKAVGPISAAGQNIQAGEDAEKFAKDMAQKQQAAYFADVAQTTLMKQPDPTTNLIDFNNPNPSTQDIYNLTNAYGGILGT